MQDGPRTIGSFLFGIFAKLIFCVFCFSPMALLPQAQGQPLVDGGIVSSSFNGSGAPRFFTFSAFVGQSFFFTIMGGPAMCYDLLGPNGSTVISSCQLTSFYFRRGNATTSGTHTLRVSPFSQGAVGNFSVRLVLAPGAFAKDRLPDQATSGNLIGGQIDAYYMDLVPGVRVLLTMDASSSNAGLYLVDPDGVSNWAGLGYLSYTAQKSGRYGVVVVNFGTSGISYLLHHLRAPGSNELGLLMNSGTVSDNITVRDVDSFTFRGVQGAPVQFSYTGTLGLTLEAYSPSGALVASGANGLNVQSLPQNGIYTLAARGTSMNASGSYNLNFSLPSVFPSYAALGDSYSSGEGVFPFVGSSVGFFSGCNRSYVAYSRLLRLPFSPVPLAWDSNTTFDFLACTGAETENILIGGEPRYGEPPQAVAAQASPRDLITLTIGGNDAAFAPILKYCLALDNCQDQAPIPGLPWLTLRNAFPLIASMVRERLVATYSELRSTNPNAAIVALDYPIVVGGNDCPLVSIPGAPMFNLSRVEQEWLREVNAVVNQAVASAASIAGVHYVSVQDHFEGHGVCGTKDDWIFGLLHVWFKGFFHPNWRGQFEYSRVLNRFLENRKLYWPLGYNRAGFPRNPPPIPSTGPFLGVTAPPAAVLPNIREDLDVQTIVSLGACGGIAPQFLIIGGSALISAGGFAPQSSVTVDVLVQRASIQLLQGTANAAGVFQSVITLPASLPISELGILRVNGTGPVGELVTVSRAMPLRLGLGGDADSDGISDGCDNCRLTPNQTQSDQDGDGRGDPCDPCIGEEVDDEDQDGLCAPVDVCPQDPLNDSDSDGVCDHEDNCPHIANVNQADVNGDSIGDACALIRCHPLPINVRLGEFGEISVTPGGCPDGRYFEGQMVRARAQPHRGYLFRGWSGTQQSTSQEILFQMLPGARLHASFGR